MPNATRILDTLPDPRVRSTLARLHAEAGRETWRMVRDFAGQLPRALLRRPLPWDRLEGRLSDKFICLEPAQGVLCYLLARSARARTIVEFGTSFGVSTIYLAAAVRDNGGGCVIGTELVPAKAERARAHLREAGLEHFAEVRVGNALDTLGDLDLPVDFMLNDGFPRFALPVLQLVAPRLRPGAIVVADNVGAFWADHGDYLRWVRDPANGFVSSLLPLNEGTELSVRAE
jgi:predicted O-methyltransferase YrrM